MADPVVAALQDMLAGEHAAVYAYGVIGGRLDYGTDEQRLANTLYERHRGLRDELLAELAAAGAYPVGAKPAYQLPVAVDSGSAARRLGQQVEDRCSVLYAGVIAVASGHDRSRAVDALTDAAVAQLQWGGSSSALPGVAQP